MVSYKMTEYTLKGYEKATRKGKMYNAILVNKDTKKEVRVPFGSNQHENFHDKTGLNLYPNLIHGDKKRRDNYRARHKVYLKEGYYSPAWFSYNILW
jgi:hypothetical protein